MHRKYDLASWKKLDVQGAAEKEKALGNNPKGFVLGSSSASMVYMPLEKNFLPSGLYRRHRNFTGSIQGKYLEVAGFHRRSGIAILQAHPALKIYLHYTEIGQACQVDFYSGYCCLLLSGFTISMPVSR